MNDNIATKFALRFLNDTTYAKLLEAVENENIEESFRMAHTLKGVSGNLGFYKLANAASELCEQLRPLKEKANNELLANVKKEYLIVVQALNSLSNR